MDVEIIGLGVEIIAVVGPIPAGKVGVGINVAGAITTLVAGAGSVPAGVVMDCELHPTRAIRHKNNQMKNIMGLV
jgi:hypothetical protein